MGFAWDWVEQKLRAFNYLDDILGDLGVLVVLERIVDLLHKLLGGRDQEVQGVRLVLVQHLGEGERLLGLHQTPEHVLDKGHGVDGLLLQLLGLLLLLRVRSGAQRPGQGLGGVGPELAGPAASELAHVHDETMAEDKFK